VVYNAGSLARPLRAALDTFASRSGATVQQENAGSLETARKLTELHKIPDLIALADYEVFPQLLMPQFVSWYAQFAHNRMVIAYTDESRDASEINADNWWKIFLRPGVQVGRADPNLDPNGYRTLLTLQLAELHYKQPKLYQRLVAALPQRNIRPKEADLVGLLQAGELDYIWSYESIAQAAKLRYLRLPEAIDLSSPAESTFYAQVSVKVMGKTPAESITFHGEPILYGLSIPKGAPHPELAERFAAFLLSPDGRRVLRQAKLDALERPIIVGSGAPPAIARLVATPER
jgi:molybdate/tungstate transport system substrate-binding protein